jgi:hypothetical protein
MLPSADQDGRGQRAGAKVSAADAADNFKNRRRVRGVFVMAFFGFMVVPPSLLLTSSLVKSTDFADYTDCFNIQVIHVRPCPQNGNAYSFDLRVVCKF